MMAKNWQNFCKMCFEVSGATTHRYDDHRESGSCFKCKCLLFTGFKDTDLETDAKGNTKVKKQ